jgi:hypothetical protein
MARVSSPHSGEEIRVLNEKFWAMKKRFVEWVD